MTPGATVVAMLVTFKALSVTFNASVEPFSVVCVVFGCTVNRIEEINDFVCGIFS